MPPREEEELDPVTLHNQALMNMDEDAETGFMKLQFLLQHNPCPPGPFDYGACCVLGWRKGALPLSPS
jgi:tetratricopeptide repeat protein 30